MVGLVHLTNRQVTGGALCRSTFFWWIWIKSLAQCDSLESSQLLPPSAFGTAAVQPVVTWTPAHSKVMLLIFFCFIVAGWGQKVHEPSCCGHFMIDMTQSWRNCVPSTFFSICLAKKIGGDKWSWLSRTSKISSSRPCSWPTSAPSSAGVPPRVAIAANPRGTAGMAKAPAPRSVASCQGSPSAAESLGSTWKCFAFCTLRHVPTVRKIRIAHPKWSTLFKTVSLQKTVNSSLDPFWVCWKSAIFGCPPPSPGPESQIPAAAPATFNMSNKSGTHQCYVTIMYVYYVMLCYVMSCHVMLC